VYKILEELYFFLPAIIALGIITSYEDLKYGKIKNKYILGALIYSFFVNLGLIIFLKARTGVINYPYLTELSISIILSLILGFFLWYNKFWTSGDAKLYFAYSALMPLSAYGFGYIKYMPNLTILINTFIPLAIFYFFKIFFRTSYKEKRQTIGNLLKIKSFFTYIFTIFIIMWLPRLLLSFGIKISFVEIMVIAILFSSFLNKLFKKNIIVILAIISIIRLILDKSVYTFQFLKQFILFSLILVGFRTFFLELGKNVFSEKKRIKDLEKGMILVDRVYKENNKYKKEDDKITISEKIQKGMKKIDYYFKQNGNGLSYEDVKHIKRLYAEKKLSFSSIRVNKTTPFAHYMFIGILITLIFKGSFIAAFSDFSHLLEEIVPKLPVLVGSIVISALITIIVYHYTNRNNKHYK